MIVIYIGNYLKCTVDQRKEDCNREPSHCHIQRNGKRVAQVWLNPLRVERGHTLNKSELEKVVSVISQKRYLYKLRMEYEANRKGNINSSKKDIYRE